MTDAAGACLPFRADTLPRTPAWFALRLRSNREFQVRDALAGRGIETFLPSWSEEVRWTDRVKTVVRPLFPGYLFARMCEGPQFYAAIITRGVVQILPNSLHPQPIDEREIENVRLVTASRLKAEACAYTEGDLVVIDSGPLAGAKGVVIRTRGALSVVVSIEMLRRSVRVELDAATLIKAAA